VIYWRRGIAVIYATAEDSARKLWNIIKKEYPSVLFKYDDNLLGKIWNCYDALVFVMALGGVVRTVCKYAKSKDVDPSVIAVDDSLKFVIPLLGSHWGSNQLASEISRILNATPVITTASEINQVTSVEELANLLICKVINVNAIVRVTSALIRGEKVCVEGVNSLPVVKGNYVLGKDAECKYFVKVIKDGNENMGDDNTVYLRPLKLYVGIGAKKEASVEEIKEAIYFALGQLKVGLDRVLKIASVREVVEEVSKSLNIPFQKIDWETINSFNDECLTPPSEKLEELGIKGVAEISAFIAGGPSAKLILRKISYKSKITVAIAGV